MEGAEFVSGLDEEGEVHSFDLVTGQGSKIVDGAVGVRSIGVRGELILMALDSGEVRELIRERSGISRIYSGEALGEVLDFDVMWDGSAVACGGQAGVAVFDRAGRMHPFGAVLPQVYGIRWMNRLGRMVGSSRFQDFEVAWDGSAFGRLEPPGSGVFVPDNTNHTPARIAIQARQGKAVVARARSIRTGILGSAEATEMPGVSEAQPEDLVLAPGGRRFAWAESSGAVWVGRLEEVPGAPSRVGVSGTRLAFLGDELLSVSGGQGVGIVSVENGNVSTVHGLELGSVRECIAQDTGPMGAVALKDGGIVLGVLERSRNARADWIPVVELGGDRRHRYRRLRFAGEDRWLGAMTEDGMLQVWDVAALLERLRAGKVLPVAAGGRVEEWIRGR